MEKKTVFPIGWLIIKNLNKGALFDNSNFLLFTLRNKLFFWKIHNNTDILTNFFT